MKHITLRQIRIFESVARHLSFSRAAEDLHLTQPAVSMQIKQVEELAGVPLFAHHGKRIALTDGGHLVLRHCQVILADLNHAEQSLADLISGGTQHLRVGVITSGSRFFPHLINAFLHDRGDVELEMKVSPRDQLIAMLRSEQIDLAVMVRAPEMPHVAAQPFAEHPFVLVAAPAHALVGARAIARGRLGAECLIVRENGTDTRHAANEAFLHRAAPPRVMELGAGEAVKQAVMAGMGISLLSAHDVEDELRDGRLRQLDVQGFPLIRHWHAVYCSDRPLPPVARAFQQFLLGETAAHIVSGQRLPDQGRVQQHDGGGGR
ncbi:LysR family transcriptional regulator [Duganella callida]|uniref:LysR family transcriptional regulator n=1 Tax=Duganella callida TaxID=2561932 RepID=A0A4Y9SHF2_9BURK|nr:LysR family transcriptional regulator [Duganella callida]TFW24333.1 LysR family transcriptional regulator [Duganella callida]